MSARILVVDDEEAIRFSLARMLSRAGHQVTEAENGVIAYAMLANGEAGPFDLMIFDIQMPGLSGMELVEKLIEKNVCPPALPMGGALDEETNEALSKLGCMEPIGKPFPRAELLERVKGLLCDA